MKNFNYLDDVKNSVLDYLSNEYEVTKRTDEDGNTYFAITTPTSLEWIVGKDGIEEFEEHLDEILWTEDSVTGNGSGSHTFSRAKAKEYVFADTETVAEALAEFCTPAKEIAEKFLSENFEYFDVSARCYVLRQAIGEAVDEWIKEQTKDEE